MRTFEVMRDFRGNSEVVRKRGADGKAESPPLPIEAFSGY